MSLKPVYFHKKRKSMTGKLTGGLYFSHILYSVNPCKISRTFTNSCPYTIIFVLGIKNTEMIIFVGGLLTYTV